MSWIKEIAPEDSEGQLAEVYRQLEESRGKAANIMTVQSMDVRAMKAHMELYMSIMFTRVGLTRKEMEMLATVVSVKNGCGYCIEHHGQALNEYLKDQVMLEGFIEDYASVRITEKQKAMLDYGAKLTVSPQDITEKDITHLRDMGFSDPEILRINMITSYFNFVNRIAMGLGVGFTEEEVEGYKV